MFTKFTGILLVAGVFLGAVTQAEASQYEIGRKAIQSLTGCYLVDYNFTETKSLKPGYSRDERVYDANNNKTVKEWVYAEEVSPNRIRLQHVLFLVGLDGKLIEGTVLKHQVEEWEYDSSFLYDFVAPGVWHVKHLDAGLWTRRITALDDGPRYQCAGKWTETDLYPAWSCDNNYAPIPGRETRDMGRKDYNTLLRATRVVAYGHSWLERQNNIKIIYDNGVKTPLAEEVGRIWYVRLPDSDCAPAQEFAEVRRGFWDLLREIWDEVLNGKEPFTEQTPAGQPPRYAKVWAIEDEYLGSDMSNQSIRERAKAEVLKVIDEYR